MRDAESLDLGALLTDRELVALAEAFGGRRLYVPSRVHDDHRITRVIGQHAAERMVEHLARNSVRVPLMRELRAQHYRGKGASKGEIASRLGMTEAGVEAIFRRIRQQNEARPTLYVHDDLPPEDGARCQASRRK